MVEHTMMQSAAFNMQGILTFKSHDLYHYARYYSATQNLSTANESVLENCNEALQLDDDSSTNSNLRISHTTTVQRCNAERSIARTTPPELWSVLFSQLLLF